MPKFSPQQIVLLASIAGGGLAIGYSVEPQIEAVTSEIFALGILGIGLLLFV